METYKILFEVIVESEAEKDIVMTEVNRAAYHMPYDTRVINGFETAFVRGCVICDCTFCIDKKEKHKLRRLPRKRTDV